MQNTPTYARYAVVLNIGLANNPLALLTDDRRNEEVARLIAQNVQASGGLALPAGLALLVTTYPALGDRETTIVVGFDVVARGFVKTASDAWLELRLAIQALAKSLNQDAIALTIADVGERGTFRGQALVGPKAGRWGPFDPNYFLGLASEPDAVRIPALI